MINIKEVIIFAFLLIYIIKLMNETVNNSNKIILFLLIFQLNKIYIERYLPYVDNILTLLSLFLSILLIIFRLKHVSINKLWIFFSFTLVIVFNGIVHFYYGGLGEDYFTGFFNILYIFLLILSMKDSLSIELLSIFSKYSKYTLIMFVLFSIYDKLILGLNRVGDFVNPNYLAYFVVVSYIFTFFNNKKDKHEIIYLFLITILTVSLTKSNSGLIAIILILVSAVISKYKFRQTFITINIFLLISALTLNHFVISGFYENIKLFDLIIKSEDTSRVFIWKTAFSDFLRSPIVGYPFNTYRVLYTSIPLVVHNDFLRILVELGVVGFSIFLYLIVQAIMVISKQEINKKFIFMSLLWVSLSFSLTHNNINNFYFWLSILATFLLPMRSLSDYETRLHKKNGTDYLIK